MLTAGQIRSVMVEAVVDTGAVRSCLPVDLSERLGLQTVRHINAQMTNGHTESVAMTEGVDLEIMGRLVTESFLAYNLKRLHRLGAGFQLAARG